MPTAIPPPPRSDADLETAVGALLAEDRTLDATGITVRVVDRTVILEGDVLSEGEYRRAAMCAVEAAADRRVENRLTIRSRYRKPASRTLHALDWIDCDAVRS